MKTRFLIVGCNGKFGAIFAAKLVEEGARVEGMDLAPCAAQPGLFEHYLSADVAKPDDAALSAINRSEGVILCIPEQSVVDGIPVIAANMEPTAVIVDIASVKTRIEQAVHRTPARSAYLSIHPMFGPLKSFEGLNICIVPFAENERSAAFVGLLEKWGAKLITMTAAEHDRHAAYVQAMSHAALLQVANTLRRAKLSLETISALSTPVQRALLALCARVVSGDPDLYWDMQSANPFAAQAREDFASAFRDFSDAAGQGDPGAFKEQFEAIAKYLEPEGSALAELSEGIVKIARREL